LGSIKVDFIGDDVSLMYALQNFGYFNNISEYQGEYPNAKEYDLVISVMNPYTAIWGWFNRKKVLYIDSLYWFWSWDNKNFLRIKEIIQELRSANNINELWSILKEIDDHHLQYVAHKLSSISCVQNYSFQTEKLKDIYRKELSVHTVGPIIDISLKRKTNKRRKVLVSLGGLYSPLNRLKESIRYANFIINLLDEFVMLLPKNIEVILTTNPEIISNIKLKNDKITVTSLNSNQFLRTLNESLITITPPSITTIYESLFYDVPLFFLPEQHDGHFQNFKRLSSDVISLSELRKIFPELLFNTRLRVTPKKDVDREILRIQGLIKKFSSFSSNPVVLDMKETLKGCLAYITNEKKRKYLLSQQQKIVLKNSNVLSIQTVQDLLDKLLQLDVSPMVTKKPRVAIISSAIEPQNKDLINKAKYIGELLAPFDIDVCTGGSIGYAHIIGLAAKKKGSRLVGYSPTKNSFLHQKEFDNAPIKDFDEIYFNENGFTARSLNFLTSVDAIIMLAGRMGTLSEFTIAFEEGTPVFILKGFGGISDYIEQVLALAKKEAKSRIFIFSDKKELLESLTKFLRLNYYH